MALHLILHLFLHHQQVPLELEEPLALLGRPNHHLLLHRHPIIRVVSLQAPLPQDVGRDHIPTVNLRQSWWKPITEDRPSTPEPAWSIPSSYLTVPMNNWASALKS
ncbi:hypothetical protein Tco_1488787, partial [Tanacetum coccineum]